jgi:hypothetical protein
MSSQKSGFSSTIGFLVGLLVIALPVAGWFLLRGPGKSPESGAPAGSSVSEGSPGSRSIGASSSSPERSAPGTGGVAVSDDGMDSGVWPIDATALREGGASLPSDEPLPARPTVVAALRRSAAWLAAHEIDPYSGSGLDSLRLFALEVECWHRIATIETDPARRAALQEETRRRLERFATGPLHDHLVASQGGGLLEILILLERARLYRVETGRTLAALEASAPLFASWIERAPPALSALYAAHLVGAPLPGLRATSPILTSPALAHRPREAAYRFNDVAALAQEIFARTGMAQRPIEGIDEASRAYLRRALPYFCLSAVLLQNVELAADLASCLVVCGLADTHGYGETIRFLLSQQNDDGSFGRYQNATRPQLLGITSGCVTALSLVPPSPKAS